MKMGSDLGKMYRRNYMVKSQLNSLEAKSRALNKKITDETKIDEWAESYITRADAQIDDVSDYMNFRNLGGLNKKMGHVRFPPRQQPATRHPYSLTTMKDSDGDKIPDHLDNAPGDYNPGQEDEDGDGVGDVADDDFGGLQGFTDFFPQVTAGNTLGAVLMLGLMGATLGVVTYDEYRGKRNVKSMLVPRLKRAAIFAGGGAIVAGLYQGVMGTGQQTGWY